MKNLSKKTKQKKKKLAKKGSAFDDVKLFLNEVVEIRFKIPMAVLDDGQMLMGVSGILMKVTKNNLFIGANDEVISIVSRDIVGLVNRVSSVHPELVDMVLPDDPNKGH